MADVILTTNTSTNQVLNTANDTYFLAEGILHYSTSATSAVVINGSDEARFLVINGTIMDLGGTAVSDSTIVDEVSIFIGQAGKVQTSPLYRAIDLDGDFSSITNYGEIVGGEAIRLDGASNEIYNAGLISSTFGSSNSTIETIIMDGENNRLVNDGTIIGESAIKFAGTGFELNNNGNIVGQQFGIEAQFAQVLTATINNSGSISVVGGDAFRGSRGTDDFTNSGTITGDMDFEHGVDVLRNSGSITGDIEMGDFSDTGPDTVINSGTISGDIVFSGAVLTSTVRNSGLIDGDVSMFSGNDLYVGTGAALVTGEVLGGLGNDTITGSTFDDRFDGGDGNDSIAGGAGDDFLAGRDDNDTVAGGSGDDTITGDNGNDELRGGSGNDDVDGGTGADSITGNSGDDTLLGDAGNDTIFGNTGNDRLNGGADIDILYGGSGADFISGDDGDDFLFGGIGDDSLFGNNDDDVLRGEAGDDTLTGGGGGDRLFGGSGADLITGGAGRDVMRGNAGADTFIYLSASDSTTAASDRIRDFEQGLDRIDISEVEDFVFVGSSAFSGTQAEVRFQTTASGLRFEMDVDGNGTVDMRVNMNNISVLTTEDFIL